MLCVFFDLIGLMVFHLPKFYDFCWWLLLMVLPLSPLPLAIVCSMVPLDDFTYALADFPQSTMICDDSPGPVVPCDDFPGLCCHLMISPSLGALVVFFPRSNHPFDDFPGPVAHYDDFPWPVAASDYFLDHSPSIGALPPPSHHSVLSSSCHPLHLLFFALFDVVHVFPLDFVSRVV